MPCYRCSARQTDPARGASPWRRGVVRGEQVLVCPDCQSDGGWTADLDACASCGSTRLAKQLGLVVCRDCGHEAPGGEAPYGGAPGLAAEVADAIERTLRSPEQ